MYHDSETDFNEGIKIKESQVTCLIKITTMVSVKIEEGIALLTIEKA